MEDKPALPKPDRSKPVILVIDDSLMLLKVYERIFSVTQELKGFRLARYAGGRMALDWLEKNEEDRPAAIFLDWMMEGMGGLEVLTKLKGDPRWKEIPVIMATSNGEHSDVIEAASKGACDYIVKPLKGHVLAQKLLKTLEAGEKPS